MLVLSAGAQDCRGGTLPNWPGFLPLSASRSSAGSGNSSIAARHVLTQGADRGLAGTRHGSLSGLLRKFYMRLGRLRLVPPRLACWHLCLCTICYIRGALTPLTSTGHEPRTAPCAARDERTHRRDQQTHELRVYIDFVTDLVCTSFCVWIHPLTQFERCVSLRLSGMQ